MSSVTKRISMISQPRGGYVPCKSFVVTQIDDGIVLNSNENIHPTIIGLAVDYLTRFIMGTSAEEAFKISICGAKIINDDCNAYRLLSNIDGMDTASVFNACQLVGYDVCARNSSIAYKPVSEIIPNEDTINNSNFAHE